MTSPDSTTKKRREKAARKRGRPITRIIKLDATPTEVARRIFANAKEPAPSIRIHNKPKK